jgi:tyrosine-protein phosphatase SIW14
MKSRLLSLTILGWLTFGPAASFAGTASPRIDGIDNFRKVNDRIYRGAQPGDQAWPALAKLGVKTVIDLRREVEHSVADEKRMVEAAGMKYVNFPMNGFDTPTPDQMTRVLALMDGGDPVFVHCKQGRDRTGTVIATWRMAREQWANEKALGEARECGLHWYENGMRRFINGYKCPTTALAERVTTRSDSVVAVPAVVAP